MPADDSSDIHCRLDELLADRGMTLTELSKRVGVSLVNLSVLKNDRAKAIRFSTLTAICEALDCQVGDLLTNTRAERGIIECAIRYPDSHPRSIRHRWLPGFAQVTPGALKFQPDLVGEGDPAGTIRPFFDVSLKGRVEPPAKRPAEVKRGWHILALETDEGLLHLAAGETGLQLLEDRLGNSTNEK